MYLHALFPPILPDVPKWETSRTALRFFDGEQFQLHMQFKVLISFAFSLVAAAPQDLGTFPASTTIPTFPNKLYVERQTPVFTDESNNQIYLVAPLAVVPILTRDFDITDGSGRIVAEVRQNLIRPTGNYDIKYSFDGRSGSATFVLPLIRYLAYIKVDGNEYRIEGDFRKGQYNIIDASGKIHASSSFESKMNVGGTVMGRIVRLGFDDSVPGPVMAAIHHLSDIYKKISEDASQQAKRA